MWYSPKCSYKSTSYKADIAFVSFMKVTVCIVCFLLFLNKCLAILAKSESWRWRLLYSFLKVVYQKYLVCYDHWWGSGIVSVGWSDFSIVFRHSQLTIPKSKTVFCSILLSFIHKNSNSSADYSGSLYPTTPISLLQYTINQILQLQYNPLLSQ